MFVMRKKPNKPKIIDLVLNQGYRPTDVARDQGVCYETIRRIIKQHQAQQETK